MYLPSGENLGSIIDPGISRFEIFLELTWKYQSSPFKAKHRFSPLLSILKVVIPEPDSLNLSRRAFSWAGKNSSSLIFKS